MRKKLFVLASSLLLCAGMQAQVYDRNWWLSFPHNLDTSFFAGEDMYGYLSPFTLNTADSLFIMNDVDGSGFVFFCPRDSINHIFLGTPPHAGLYQIKITDNSLQRAHGSKRYDLLVYSPSDTVRTTASLFQAPAPPDNPSLYRQMIDSVIVLSPETINAHLDADANWAAALNTNTAIQVMDPSYIECKLDTTTPYPHMPTGQETMNAVFFFSREEPLVLLVLNDPADSCRYPASKSQAMTKLKTSVAFDYLTGVLVPKITVDDGLRTKFAQLLKNVQKNGQFRVTYARDIFADLMGAFLHTDASQLRTNILRVSREKKYFNQIMVLLVTGFTNKPK
jgi:hypothetical protein